MLKIKIKKVPVRSMHTTTNLYRPVRMKIRLVDYEKNSEANKFLQALKGSTKLIPSKSGTIVIDLDGSKGYSPYFINKTFSELQKPEYGDCVKRITFKSKDEPTLPAKIQKIMGTRKP